MRFKGTLTTWKDDQGFGFVTTSGKTDKFFVHIKSFKYNSRRPCVGDLLVYEVTTDSKNRPQAINIQFLHDFEREKLRNKRFSQQEDGKNLLSKIAAYPFLIYLAILFFADKVSVWVLGFYLLINIWTYLLYRLDKNAAQNNQRRTPEDTLHLFSLLGGWIGALIAQLTLRHKSQKQEFRQTFWASVVANIVILTLLASIGFTKLSFLENYHP